MDDKIYFQKIIPDFREFIDLILYIQYQKIIIHLGEISRLGGDMYIFSLQELSTLQFKGMSVYDKDIYRLKQDQYKNWDLLNTTKYNKARDIAADSADIKEKDYTIQILSRLEGLVVNRILQQLQS